jgi:hypothetical protein
MFFSEEKNQKTFASGACGWIRDLAGEGEAADWWKRFGCFLEESSGRGAG